MASNAFYIFHAKRFKKDDSRIETEQNASKLCTLETADSVSFSLRLMDLNAEAGSRPSPDSTELHRSTPSRSAAAAWITVLAGRLVQTEE